MNPIEFNYETFLEGKHKLVTRGGIEVPREALSENAHANYAYKYKLNVDEVFIYANGKPFCGRKECEYDLFMIPIQTDETIPFDLEKWKSGEWDVVDNEDGAIANNAYWVPAIDTLVLIWGKDALPYEKDYAPEALSLRKKPISPFTHPHLYEVSGCIDADYESGYYSIEKYYAFEPNDDYPHKVRKGKNGSRLARHLRLKQPTEISKDQAFDAVANLESVKEKLIEKFGTFKIK